MTHRYKLCCAQVAVQPLEEICFPHYILLDEADVGTSVRRFGNTIARLVRRAMSGGSLEFGLLNWKHTADFDPPQIG